MEPTSAAILGSAALNAASSIFGASKSTKSAKKAAAMQIAWERERAQNAHQWEVQDLKKAGLNPVLSANGGAQTGSINPPMPDTSGYTSAGQALQAGINSAISNKQAETAKKLAESQGFKNIMDGLEAGERTKTIPEHLINETRNSLTAQAQQRAQERNMEKQNDLLEQQTIHQTFDNAIKEIETGIKTGNFGKTMAYIDRLMETVKNTGGAISSFMPTIAMWRGATSLSQLGKMINTFKSSNAYKLMNNYK